MNEKRCFQWNIIRVHITLQYVEAERLSFAQVNSMRNGLGRGALSTWNWHKPYPHDTIQLNPHCIEFCGSKNCDKSTYRYELDSRPCGLVVCRPSWFAPLCMFLVKLGFCTVAKATLVCSTQALSTATVERQSGSEYSIGLQRNAHKLEKNA